MFKLRLKRRKYVSYLLFGAIVGVVVFGAGLWLFIQPRDTYPESAELETYGSSISFEYPARWNLQACGTYNTPFIELPGVMLGNYAHKDDYPLRLASFEGTGCDKSGKVQPNYDPNRKIVSKDCSQVEGLKGERVESLSNNLYLHLITHEEGVRGLAVVQDACYSEEGGYPLFRFYFIEQDYSIGSSAYDYYGKPPTVNKEKFLNSPQYNDIKRFAQSIRPAE